MIYSEIPHIRSQAEKSAWLDDNDDNKGIFSGKSRVVDKCTAELFLLLLREKNASINGSNFFHVWEYFFPSESAKTLSVMTTFILFW